MYLAFYRYNPNTSNPYLVYEQPNPNIHIFYSVYKKRKYSFPYKFGFGQIIRIRYIPSQQPSGRSYFRGLLLFITSIHNFCFKRLFQFFPFKFTTVLQ